MKSKLLTKNYLPLFYALIAVFLWGIHGPAGRWLTQNNVDIFFVFSIRLWIGTIIFFIYLLFTNGFSINFKDFITENLKKVLIISFIGLVANTIVFHVSLIYLPGTYVMIIENLSPIFVFGATALIYKIKPKSKEIYALILSLLGIMLIIIGKKDYPELSDTFYIGLFYCILAAITFGGYIFFSTDLMRDYKNDTQAIIRFLFKIFLIAAIVCTPFIFISKGKPETPLQWFWIIEMGIFQSGLAYIFWNLALAHISANTMSLLFMLTIITTSVNEILFLGFRVSLLLVIGCILICYAGYWVSREK